MVRLDSHAVADAEAHSTGEDEEMMRRFDSPRRATLEETRGAMQRWIDARADGSAVTYAVRTPSRELIGGCEIRLITAARANVSYWLFPAFRGHGYAARALALLSAAAAAITGLEQLEAHIDADNAASRRLAERCGYAEAGTVEDEAWTGERSTRLLFVRAL